MKRWQQYSRPGDWLVVTCAACCVAASYPLFWHGGRADKAVVRRDGQVVAELPLTAERRIEIEGAMGKTVIEVQPGRARIAADPGPRQYCVRQGWLNRPNAWAICAPSHISLTLVARITAHDTLSY